MSLTYILEDILENNVLRKVIEYVDLVFVISVFYVARNMRMLKRIKSRMLCNGVNPQETD